MKLDVNAIENDIYTKICSDFAEVSEKKLQRYRTVLEFLRATDVEKIVTPTTLEVYQQYKQFCASLGFKPLEHTVFSKTVCECGFTTHRVTKTIKGNKKKFIYFVMC